MRTYILTEKEKQAIEQFLKDKLPNDYIHLIKHRAKKCLLELKADIELLEKLLNS